MCGIAGMFGPEGSMSLEQRHGVINQMCRVIEHRGPDDDGSIWIVFNGEIYNFKELRDDLIRSGHSFQTGTDTEVIVHLYEDEGERCVERLRGMFAFAIWDKREQKLFIARDRVGVKPLHYCVAGETLVFASEIKSILKIGRAHV